MIETKNYSKQVFIVGESHNGIVFDIHCDIPSRRSYPLKKFVDRHLYEFFGEWHATHFTLINCEPRDATITFHNTKKGRELATMFKLGHEWL